MKKSFTVVGKIVKGALDIDRAYLTQSLRQLPDGPIQIDVGPVEDARSRVANAYYWSCVVNPIADYTEHTPEEVHDAMCDRFLKYTYLELDRRTGEVAERVIAGRTSGLKVGQFYRFVEQVRLFAMEFHGLTTQDPDKEYRKHRDRAYRQEEAAA